MQSRKYFSAHIIIVLCMFVQFGMFNLHKALYRFRIKLYHYVQDPPAHRILLHIGSSCTLDSPEHRFPLSTGSLCAQAPSVPRIPLSTGSPCVQDPPAEKIILHTGIPCICTQNCLANRIFLQRGQSWREMAQIKENLKNL